METCYKCHAAIPPGKIFCPECRAPLIRVIVPEPSPESAPVTSSVPPYDAIDSKVQVVDQETFQWRHAVRVCVRAAIVGTTFMFFPVAIGILGMIASGALSAIFYYHRASAKNLTTGAGAKLGALTGVFGGVFTTVCTPIALHIVGSERVHAVLVERLNEIAAQNHDPVVLQWINYFKTPAGLTTILVLGTIFTFILFLSFATVGGALGAAWVRRRHRP